MENQRCHPSCSINNSTQRPGESVESPTSNTSAAATSDQHHSTQKSTKRHREIDSRPDGTATNFETLLMKLCNKLLVEHFVDLVDLKFPGHFVLSPFCPQNSPIFTSCLHLSLESFQNGDNLRIYLLSQSCRPQAERRPLLFLQFL